MFLIKTIFILNPFSRHLNPANEMKRRFGASVVEQDRRYCKDRVTAICYKQYKLSLFVLKQKK